MHNSSQCYLQPLSIRCDLRDLIVNPVDKVRVACGQEAVLRDEWVSDFRGNIIYFVLIGCEKSTPLMKPVV